MSTDKQTFIDIQKGRIHTGFRIYHKEFENGMFSWYIPGYNIRFSSTDKETGRKRALIMVKAFFAHWTNKASLREFILEIHKLGFKASDHHELTVSRLISKKINSAKFKSTIVRLPNPSEYKRSEVLETDLELAEA